MRLHRLIIENFRGYAEPTSVVFGEFTSIIGRNDVGKSTVFEALDTFFNERKLDADDANIFLRGNPSRISCEFDNLPTEVIIDAQVRTGLANEFLLNARGFFEVVKEFDLSSSKISVKIFARASHPSADGVNDLLQLNNTKLKSRALEKGVDLEGVDQRINSELRAAIWGHAGELARDERLIPLNIEGAKEIWAQLQLHLPIFALFQADRASRDDDNEVTSPMDAAIKEAVKGVEGKLDEIKEEVRRKVEEVAKRTLSKLREMDASLADELRTEFKAEPKWTGFKLSLYDHNNIPINKRGSGVRRLILLNFFRAEAERRQENEKATGIIYAIEEPESSQHPLNQQMLINALLDLSTTGNTQVMITTHVPGIVSLVPPESIRYIRLEGAKNHPRIIQDDENIIKTVADQLGILPDKRVKLLVCVEGPNDVNFLESVSRNFPHIDLVTDSRVAFLPLGGGNIKHWVNRQYLRELGLREIHIYDRDDDFAYQGHADEVNNRRNGDWATLTKKREIENYLHPDAIKMALNIDLDFDDGDDVPMLVAKAIHEAAPEARPWREVDEESVKKKISRAKRRLCGEAAAQLTTEMLQERDPDGEMEGWFRRIAEAVA